MKVHILESLNSLRTPGPSYKASASALQSTSDHHTNHLYNARNLGFNLFILFLDVFISHIGGSSYIQSGLPYWLSPFLILKRKTSWSQPYLSFHKIKEQSAVLLIATLHVWSTHHGWSPLKSAKTYLFSPAEPFLLDSRDGTCTESSGCDENFKMAARGTKDHLAVMKIWNDCKGYKT